MASHHRGTASSAVEKAKGEPWRKLKNRHADGALALILTPARKISGLTQRQLAPQLEPAPSMNTSTSIQRYQQRLRRDRSERALAPRAEEMINAIA